MHVRHGVTIVLLLRPFAGSDSKQMKDIVPRPHYQNNHKVLINTSAESLAKSVLKNSVVTVINSRIESEAASVYLLEGLSRPN